ncbi:zinc-binding alcohol dehydrogenase family protein [Rhizobacter sp. LjRoot28]|uniref:zinc-binding alcohol dehydrogenase family protein n=1 Tax=Rhizobacter sp. LjRoot28 TaxID=3342309 RepID=UPI003ECD5FFB
MKAVVAYEPRAADHPEALVDTTLPDPTPGPRDLLVRVEAVSVNPVDTKVRRRGGWAAGEAKVLGYDAAGTVVAVGAAVSLFKPGDRVYYAGDITRAGSNAELQVVDERIVGPMPTSLGFAEAAALPLTAITAWELLFDRFGVTQDSDGTLLVVGAAGGVGSILVQLARQMSGMRVVGTASRPETREWVLSLGAHAVIDHAAPLGDGLRQAGIGPVAMVASLTHTDRHYAALVEALAPQGRLGLIDDPETPLDVMALKRKSLSLHWEMMFARSMFQTPDMQAQHELLARVAGMVDAGTLRTTVGEHFGTINASNLRRAHQLVESGRARGKVVLASF